MDITTFLKYTTNKLKTNNFTSITMVLGNESCDLDSAVSAFVYATFLHWQYCKTGVTSGDKIFVPILNVARKDYELKTEVNYSFKSNNIDGSSLIFRDDFNFEELLQAHETNVVLVDHHVLSKNDVFVETNVTEIIDHRPKDVSSWKYKENTKTTIDIVGSCTTLIFKRIQEMCNEDFFKAYPICADLLYGTIILDTVNFSKEVNKATPLDVEVVTALEQTLKINDPTKARESKLSNLVSARRDVSQLTPAQLLRKDVKTIATILVPSFPIPVSEFLQKQNVELAMREALEGSNTNILLLLGMKLDGASVTRDLAVYALDKHLDEAAKLATLLEVWSHPSLDLAIEDTTIQNCQYYRQNNLSASRKQVIPVVNEYFKTCE